MKIITIVGPTGVGKTKLSIALAKYYNAEIINGDSMQVYKKLDIGSAKPIENEKENIEKLNKYEEKFRKNILIFLENKHIIISVSPIEDAVCLGGNKWRTKEIITIMAVGIIMAKAVITRMEWQF